jgi:hypothetical protein
MARITRSVRAASATQCVRSCPCKKTRSSRVRGHWDCVARRLRSFAGASRMLAAGNLRFCVTKFCCCHHSLMRRAADIIEKSHNAPANDVAPRPRPQRGERPPIRRPCAPGEASAPPGSPRPLCAAHIGATPCRTHRTSEAPSGNHECRRVSCSIHPRPDGEKIRCRSSLIPDSIGRAYAATRPHARIWDRRVAGRARA